MTQYYVTTGITKTYQISNLWKYFVFKSMQCDISWWCK